MARSAIGSVSRTDKASRRSGCRRATVAKPEMGAKLDGEEGASHTRLASGDDLRLQPGWLRGELPVLFDGAAWAETEPKPGEIVGQTTTVLTDHPVHLATERINLVFTGQGEPFINHENVMKAVRLLSETGVGVPVSRMTISTSASCRASVTWEKKRSGRTGDLAQCSKRCRPRESDAYQPEWQIEGFMMRGFFSRFG